MSENTQNLQDASVDAGVPKALNYIEKLVAELCPEGVEYVELGRLGKRNSGTSITAAKMKQIKNPVVKYVFLQLEIIILLLNLMMFLRRIFYWAQV